MSLRLRLTLWYVSLLAVILIMFGAGLFLSTSYSLNEQIRQDLESRTREVQSAFNTALAVQSDPLTILRQGGILIPSAETFATGDIYVQISAFDGSVISKSSNLGNQRLILDPTAEESVANGQSTTYDFSSGDTRLRAMVSPLLARGRPFAVITVGQSLRQVDLALTRLLTVIVVVILFGLLLAFFGGAFLARTALQPIDRITQTARQITEANDLSRRLKPAGGADDEVGRLVQTFNEMLARIEELFRSQQRFVADVSHELRSPLTSIRGNLDLIRRGAASDPDARREIWQAVDSETDRMSRLVSDLLLLAQADAGIPIRQEAVELDTILLDVYRHGQVVSNGVQMVLGNEDQATVLGDPDRLKQLFLNLVDNALKYTPAGGKVELSWEREDGDIKVAVADSGIGISSQDLPHLFDRFYRVDKARSRSAGGTGLGLAIAKYVADAHGGRIAVESEVGKGTRFVVWLPLAAESAAPPATTSAPSVHSSVSA